MTSTLSPSPPFTPPLPPPRGPVSETVVRALAREPTHPFRAPALGDPLGEDLQLALYLCHELHYQGFTGVDPDWEWEPRLIGLRGAMERSYLDLLRDQTLDGGPVSPAAVTDALEALLVEPVDGDGVTHHLRDRGERRELREFVAHRSVYHLKEADPHAWVIPRLRGRAKAAVVAVEFDEFGGGRAERMHARLFADLMDDLGLDSSYNGYLDLAPAETLAVVTMMSMFGLRRSLRGALVGHFAAAEITTPPAARRMTAALERLGAGPRATTFYTEHIEADAVHEQVLRHEVVEPLLAEEPELAADVLLGVRATEFVEERFGAHLLGCWRDSRPSLRAPLPHEKPVA
jgi:Iron-containing redox enzyme